MAEADSGGAGVVRMSAAEGEEMASQTDAYFREQIEKRRDELTAAIASAAPGASKAPFLELLQEVDSALHRLDEGTYGICPACHDPVEKERLLADPLTTMCIDHLTEKDRRALEHDLEAASKVQRGLLPEKILRHGDWHVQYEYRPMGLVGGDYCDLIAPKNGDGKLVFLLGDVAGKGVAASLLMSHLHAMFRSLAGVGPALGEMLETANRVFCESTFAGQYATLVCGRAAHDGEVEIASAGHLPALHVCGDGVKQISATGLPLGMFLNAQYEVARVRLERGDSLVMFTDGISEAQNPAGDEYGVLRLSSVVGERHRWTPKELLGACARDLERFAAGTKSADDQTLMVVHRGEVEARAIGE